MTNIRGKNLKFCQKPRKNHQTHDCVSSENDTEKVLTSQQEIVISQWKIENIKQKEKNRSYKIKETRLRIKENVRKPKKKWISFHQKELQQNTDKKLDKGV